MPSAAAPSEALSAVIAMMLRVNATTRPTSTQLLAHPELQRKIIQLGMDSGEGSAAPITSGPPPSIMNTIKVPMALKRLQEALPKACYPSQVQQQAPVAKSNGPETVESASSKVPALPVAMLMQQQQQQQQLFSQQQPQQAGAPLPPSGRPRRPLAPLPPPASNQQPSQEREQGSHKAVPKAMNPRPPLVPLAQDGENQRPVNGVVGSAKELQREAEPAAAAPKVRFNRRIW